MTARDRRGMIILILLFVALGVVLAVMSRRPGNANNTFEDNPIVEQRIINLQKSR